MLEKAITVTDLIDSQRMRPAQYAVFFMCALVMFIDGIDTQIFSFALPHIAHDLSLQQSALGPLLSAALAGLFVGYTTVSPLSHRFGHRRLLICCILAFGTFTILLAFAQSVTQMMILRFLAGVGLAGVIPSAMALTSEFTPKRLRASFIVYIHMGLAVGFLSAGVLAGMLLPGYGWRVLLISGGVIALVIMVLLALFLPESLEFMIRNGQESRVRAVLQNVSVSPLPAGRIIMSSDQPMRQSVVAALVGRKNIVSSCVIWLIFAINLTLFYSIILWLPTVLPKVGYSSGVSITATTLISTASVVFAFVIGPGMDRFGTNRIVALLYLLTVLMLFVTGYALSLTAQTWILLSAVFLLGIGVGGGMQGANAMATVFYPPQMRAVGAGWALGIGRLGAIVGPLMVGWLLGLGWSVAQIFYAAAIPALVAVIAVIALERFPWKDEDKPAVAAVLREDPVL